jgi:tRNA threonylcarbamoyl adenosine modification protein YeaZ
MNIFIDTHLNDVVIILTDENNNVFKEKIIQDERQNSKVIMPTIKKILNKKVPDSIIVVNGPGSFTGVRLGVTIAKTMGYTMKKPVRTITSLECMAVCSNDKEKIMAFSDNNGYYIGIFDENNNLVGNYEYLNNSEFAKFSEKYKVIQDIKLDYSKIVAYALTKEPTIAHEVNPIYVKKIDVEK